MNLTEIYRAMKWSMEKTGCDSAVRYVKMYDGKYIKIQYPHKENADEAFVLSTRGK